MLVFDNDISYIKSTNDPLSSDVFFINDNNTTYIYDVGSSNEALKAIMSYDPDNTIIAISHFHDDHTANLYNLFNYKIYGYKFSQTKFNFIVDPISTENIKFIDFPSSHSKGSLALYIKNKKILFVGDAIYSSGTNTFNYNKLLDAYHILLKLNPSYVVVSHRPNPFLKFEIIKSYYEKLLNDLRA